MNGTLEESVKAPHPIDILASRYPRLCMPIRTGISATQEYISVCREGKPTSRRPCFNTTPEDRLETVSTPAGEIEILYLADRDDFIHAFRALSFKCEPAEIPPSCGAVTLLGLINREKVNSLELPPILSEPSSYTDNLILLSKGPYSGVPASAFGLEKSGWLRASYTIRKYHELTHFVSRKRFPENTEAIRDEVMADMIGLLFAYGRYDTVMARRFLGIDTAPCRKDGRLQIYINNKSGGPDAAALCADSAIRCFSDNLPEDVSAPFDILTDFETRRLAL